MPTVKSVEYSLSIVQDVGFLALYVGVLVSLADCSVLFRTCSMCFYRMAYTHVLAVRYCSGRRFLRSLYGGGARCFGVFSTVQDVNPYTPVTPFGCDDSLR